MQRIHQTPVCTFNIRDFVSRCIQIDADRDWDHLKILLKMKEDHILDLGTEFFLPNLDPPLMAVTADGIRKRLMKED